VCAVLSVLYCPFPHNSASHSPPPARYPPRMSAAERRALLLLLSLGLLGQGVRWWLTRPGDAPGEVQLLEALPPRSPAAHRDSILALARPLGPDERIDADRASAPELARLPRARLA